jgi:hypothetical protein
MRNIAHNGFGCPYCRVVMAEKPEENENENEENITITSSYEYNDDDYMLRGFRMFFNNVNGEEHDPEDVLEEKEDQEDSQEEIHKPSPAYLCQKLMEQGIDMEMMIKAFLSNRDEYDSEEEEFLRIDDHVWSKVDNIIKYYDPATVEEESQNTHETPIMIGSILI